MRYTETRELRPQPARFPNSHFATHLQYSVLYQQVMGLCVLPVSAPSPGLKIIIFRPAAQLQPLISMSTTQAHGHDRTEIDTAHHPNTSLYDVQACSQGGCYLDGPSARPFGHPPQTQCHSNARAGTV
ncbi:hypothetical protein AcV5_006689 [Taiwanofungus camphoratus]|nr:hypothetical protein AcV5_006689 [Antrodia cinnamomea]